MRTYYIYIMANDAGVFYVGITNNLKRRVFEHRSRLHDGFVTTQRLSKLVYYESTENVAAAIKREKQLKKWTRSRKVYLIQTINPKWLDLSRDWFW